jgi:hypothetical protein
MIHCPMNYIPRAGDSLIRIRVENVTMSAIPVLAGLLRMQCTRTDLISTFMTCI